MTADKAIPCPATRALAVLGGKWKLVILCRLYSRAWRFNELSREIDGITKKMLTQQLRELENDGLVHRKVYREVPPRVEYSLTAFGESVRPIIGSLNDWGERCLDRKKR